MPPLLSSESIVDAEESVDLNDVTYVPWPAPRSRVQALPHMVPASNFVVSRGMILYDAPLTISDRTLPSPNEVRTTASLKGKHHIVPFPDLGVVVKYGRRRTEQEKNIVQRTSLAEAQSLFAVRHLLGGRVPVPEVYAFIQDGQELFLYMELVQGVTLLECWPDLSNREKMDVCGQLKSIMETLRELEQDPSDQFIGTIGREPVQDRLFEGCGNPVLFKSIADFHDYFDDPRDPLSSPSFNRRLLHDDQQIYFTHGDINRVNIIVSPPTEGPVRIRAIIDWKDAGWYPANWEYCTARWQTSSGEEWQRCLPKFLEKWPERWYWEWDYFTLSLV